MHEFKKKITVQAIVFLCIIGIFSAFLVLFRQNISHQVEIIASLQARKFQFSQSADEIIGLKKEWEIAKGYEAALASYGIKKDGLLSIPQKLETSAKSRGLSLSFSYQTETDAQNYSASQVIPFTASMEGPAGASAEFLKYMDANFHVIRIETMDVLQASSTARISFSGKVFYQ